MSLQFISDDSGNKTAVVIPIEDWNNMVHHHPDLKKIETSVPKSGSKKIKPSDFKGIISQKEAGKFHKYLTKVRKEWERDFY